MRVLSHFSRVRLFVTLWTVAHWAPLSMEFSRQEYWRGLPFPSPEDLPDPGIKPASSESPALTGRFFASAPPRKLPLMPNFLHDICLGHDIVKESEVTQLCPTLCDPMDCCLPGSSVHGIVQARILEWVAVSFSRGSSPPRAQTRVSRIASRLCTV